MLILMRPANLITAVADIVAGFGLSYIVFVGPEIWQGLGENLGDFFLLWIATIGLYGGGVVFNDVFDLKLDKIERPERPLPSGKVQKQEAVVLGLSLLIIGIISAFFVSNLSGFLAIAIACLAVLYDAKGKHHTVLGPINMALCRGGNLLLGVSAFAPELVSVSALIAFPLIYIASITLISQGEVNGGNRLHLNLAVLGYSLVMLMLVALQYLYAFQLSYALPFMIFFAGMVFPALFNARKSLQAQDIRKAVKAGVICLIVLNASIAAGFCGILYGLMILALLPLSMALAKVFSVT